MSDAQQLPRLVKQAGHFALMVDGQPFLIVLCIQETQCTKAL